MGVYKKMSFSEHGNSKSSSKHRLDQVITCVISCDAFEKDFKGDSQSFETIVISLNHKNVKKDFYA